MTYNFLKNIFTLMALSQVTLVPEPLNLIIKGKKRKKTIFAFSGINPCRSKWEH